MIDRNHHCAHRDVQLVQTPANLTLPRTRDASAYYLSMLGEREPYCHSTRDSKVSIKYKITGTIVRTPGSGRPSKITAEVNALVERQMRHDDETTAAQLHVLLVRSGFAMDLRTVLRCRTSPGWTFRGSSYCQLIRHENKQKRLDWARLHRTDSFEDVIWTDECTVQMESHRRFCCRKRGEAPRPKPR